MTVTVDGAPVTVDPGSSILEACRKAGADVPTLCYTETLAPAYTCRACVVETGPGALVPACAAEASDGMNISTGSRRVARARAMVFELLASTTDLSRVPTALVEWFPADTSRMGSPVPPRDERPSPATGHHRRIEPGSAATTAEPVKIEDDLYVRNYSACILCFRCVDACGEQHQNSFAIATAGRGFDTRISTEFDHALPDSACVYCGNCIAVCPTGALVGKIQWDMRAAGTWDPGGQQVTRSICGYCGVGCNLDVTTQDGAIVEVSSPVDHDVTLGNLCIKGRFGWRFVSSNE